MKSTNNAAEPELRSLLSTWLVGSAVSWLQLPQHRLTVSSLYPPTGCGSLELCRDLQHGAGAEGGQDGTSSLSLRM